MRARLVYAVLAGAPLLAACSSSARPSDTTETELPPEADVVAFSRVTNILLAPVTVNGTTALLGVDTGDPFLFLNPKSYPQAPAVGHVSVTIGAFSGSNVPVITSTQSPTSPDSVVPLGGLLGCDVICSHVVAFDYQSATFTIDPGAPPGGLEPEVIVPFRLEGGGVASFDNQQVTVPRSRVVVDVDIEGTTRAMIVDTGASEVAVDLDTFVALTADSRATLSTGGVETTLGTSTATVTRAKTIALGGVSLDRVVVSHDDSFDNNIDAVSQDAGETIAGSLGGTFLSSFYVTIDYPNQKLHLARYADTSFVIDSAASVGIELQASDSRYLVAAVAKGSDAADKGVTAGDILVSVDGQPLAGASTSEIGVLFGGQVGSTKQLGFGVAKTLTNQTVSVTLSDLLPVK